MCVYAVKKALKFYNSHELPHGIHPVYIDKSLS